MNLIRQYFVGIKLAALYIPYCRKDGDLINMKRKRDMVFKTSILAALLIAGTSQTAIALPVLTNGDFETGDLTGWTTTGLGTTGNCPAANRDWNVSSTNSTGCSSVGSPPEGNFAAYNMFDGAGPLQYGLYQSFNLSNGITAANLSWIQATAGGFGGERTFQIDLLDAAGTNVLTNLYTEIFSISNNNINNPWHTMSIDVTSELLAFQGQDVTLGFIASIPRTWSGAAGFGLDSVNLDIRTSVPEPSVFALLGLGLVGLGFVRRKDVY